MSQSGASGSSGNNSAAAERAPMYFAQPNCSALSASDQATLAQIGQASWKAGGRGRGACLRLQGWMGARTAPCCWAAQVLDA